MGGVAVDRVIFDEVGDISPAAMMALEASAAVQQERAGKALVRYLTDRLPSPPMSLRAKVGCLNNGVSDRAVIAGLARYPGAPCHRSKNREHLFNSDNRCVHCGGAK